jgi:hypothetical protein
MVTPIASGFGNWFTSSCSLMVEGQATCRRMREAGSDRIGRVDKIPHGDLVQPPVRFRFQSLRTSVSAAHSPRVRRSVSRIPRRT